MDRREMKKHILATSLSEYESLMLQRNTDGSGDFDIGMILDKDETEVTDAERRRFYQLLREMVENAESKLK